MGIGLAIVLLLVLWGLRRRSQSRFARVSQDNAALKSEVARLKNTEARLRNEEAQRREEAERRRRYYDENDIANGENQLRFVAQCELRSVRPVNPEAVQVFYALNDWIEQQGPKRNYYLSFEVAMGAFVKTSGDPQDRRQKSAFSSYNSKRVDFLLIDRRGYPQLVVEYNGTGHDLSGDAEERMAVKRLVLQRAGIPLIEIPAHATKPQILGWVSDAMGKAGARK